MMTLRTVIILLIIVGIMEIINIFTTGFDNQKAYIKGYKKGKKDGYNKACNEKMNNNVVRIDNSRIIRKEH